MKMISTILPHKHQNGTQNPAFLSQPRWFEWRIENHTFPHELTASNTLNVYLEPGYDPPPAQNVTAKCPVLRDGERMSEATKIQFSEIVRHKKNNNKNIPKETGGILREKKVTWH